MEYNEPQFKRLGLSSDGAVVFCEMDNDKTYAMPISALEKAENWNPRAKPKTVRIIDGGFAAVVGFDNGVKIDFASDFVLHICEPAYAWYNGKSRASCGVGKRIREIREARGLTLGGLAAKCGIAKPNLSRLENDKLTPTSSTLSAVAAGLRTHPVLLVAAKKPDHAWTWTLHKFVEWKLGLLWQEGVGTSLVTVCADDLVNTFLATRPEHGYARSKLLKYANPNASDLAGYTLDRGKWEGELATAQTAKNRVKAAKHRSAATVGK